MNHHMNINCKPYVPTQRLLYGKKEDLMKLFPSPSEIETERKKREQFLTKKQADIQFCLGELEVIQEESINSVCSSSPEVLQELESKWIGLVEL